jgi:YegS/Rv2252/BmrU family lipid kinase
MSEPWIAIQRNPNSGSGRRQRHLLELISELKRRGIRTRLYSRREKLDAALETAAARESLIAIVAAGGDGTAADVINRYPDLPVCPFPLGTENLLCKYLGVSLDAEKCADRILNGTSKKFDIGIHGDQRFVLMASVGFDAEVIRRLHQTRTGNIRRLTYLSPILKSVFGYSFPELRIYLDDNEEPLTGCMVVVSNLPAYGFGLPITPTAVGDDGKFSLCIFKQPGGFRLFRYWIRVKRMKHMDRPDIIHAEAVKVRIESDIPAPVQMDGDPGGMTPCVFEIQPASVRLVVANE